MKNFYFLSILAILGCFSQVSAINALNDDPNFFPLGVWLQSTPNAKSYKDAGINLYIGLWDTLDVQQLNDLLEAGMKVLCDQKSFGLSHLNDTIIYGWTQMDEPDNAQWNESTQSYDPCVEPAIIIDRYNQMKLNDPSRPVFLGLGQGVAWTDYYGRGDCTGNIDSYKKSKNGYTKGCDIVCFDIYPVNSSDTATSGKLWLVPKGIDSLYSWSDNQKPAWAWIETTQISSDSPRKPTTDEVKAEVWMAIIHGAKGIGYFCHSWTPQFDEAALMHDLDMIVAVKHVNHVITLLASILNSPDVSGYATVSISNENVPVDFIVKDSGSYHYIFAVAMRNESTTATFSVASGMSVEVLWENRTIDVVNGQFTDDFAGYGVHLYKISPSMDVKDSDDKRTGIYLYPNPCTDFIELPDELVNSNEIVILSITGLSVYRMAAAKRIDIRFLSPGIYFLKSGEKVWKFVKI